MDKFSKEERSRIMRAVHSKNTRPEVVFRKALWHHGIRYRKNYAKLPGKPDIAITRCKIAIFIDGDFWHGKGHMDHPGEQIKSNVEYWHKKIDNNIKRDKAANDELLEMGWLVFRFWTSDIHKNIDKYVSLVCEYCKK